MWKRLSVTGPSVANNVPSEMGESAMTDMTPNSTMNGRTSRPSLVGLMLGKRFAKRLSSKVMDRKMLSAGLIHDKEPTYRMEPTRKFNACLVEKVIKATLEEKLDGFTYNPKFCSNMIKVLSDELKDKVKLMGFDRYKIICNIVLCQRSEQALQASSRCTWDAKHDDFAAYTYKNEHFVCNAAVFGIYHE